MGQEPHSHPHEDFPFFLSRRIMATIPITTAISTRLTIIVAILPNIQLIINQIPFSNMTYLSLYCFWLWRFAGHSVFFKE